MTTDVGMAINQPIIGYNDDDFEVVTSYRDPVTGVTTLFADEIEIPSAGPAFTFAGLPSAVGLAGYTVRVTDIGGASGALFISDGAQWTPLNGQCNLAKSAIPMILQSSGSVGNNGALTGITALDKTYTAAYLYFPAGAIVAGSAAGWYYTVMAGTTSGTVYNNVYTSGNPTVPTSPTPFVTTGPGAYTQTTAVDIPSLSVSVPANALGLYGGIDFALTAIVNNTAGTKTGKGFYGATAFEIITAVNNTFTSVIGGFSNAGLANKQYQNTQDFAIGLVGGASYTPTTGAINSAAAQDAKITLKLAVATDYMILVRGKLDLIGG